MSIVFPFLFLFLFSGKRSKIMAATAWSAPLFLSVTSAVIFKILPGLYDKLPHCIPPALVPGSWQYKAYTMYVVFGFFYIPLIVIAICYIVMIIAIWRRSRYMTGPSSSSKKKGNGKLMLYTLTTNSVHKNCKFSTFLQNQTVHFKNY